jgi:hypothetical protein
MFFVALLHEDREFAYIHERNWNEQMWNIAGWVDFQSLMEERVLDRWTDPKGPMASLRVC